MPRLIVRCPIPAMTAAPADPLSAAAALLRGTGLASMRSRKQQRVDLKFLRQFIDNLLESDAPGVCPATHRAPAA